MEVGTEAKERALSRATQLPGAGRTRTGPSGSPGSALCSHQTGPSFIRKLALILESADGQAVSWLSQSPLKDYELLEGRTVFWSLFYSHRVA